MARDTIEGGRSGPHNLPSVPQPAAVVLIDGPRLATILSIDGATILSTDGTGRNETLHSVQHRRRRDGIERCVPHEPHR